MRTLRRRLAAGNMSLKQVECIHADKRQMIQTDWIPGVDTKIELDMRLSDVVKEDGLYNSIFYCTEADRNVVFTANFGGGANQYQDIYIWNDKTYGHGGVINKVASYYYTIVHNPFTVSSKECTWWRKAEWYTEPDFQITSLETRTAANTIPVLLLGSPNAPLNRYDVWLYGVRCWNDGVLERDYVPAVRSGVYGLWDKIGGKFLKSCTGVNFLGPE